MGWSGMGWGLVRADYMYRSHLLVTERVEAVRMYHGLVCGFSFQISKKPQHSILSLETFLFSRTCYRSLSFSTCLLFFFFFASTSGVSCRS